MSAAVSTPDELATLVARVHAATAGLTHAAQQADPENVDCLACHGDLVHELVGGVNGKPDEVQCVHCHSSVGHGETTGLGGPARADEIEGNAS